MAGGIEYRANGETGTPDLYATYNGQQYALSKIGDPHFATSGAPEGAVYSANVQGGGNYNQSQAYFDEQGNVIGTPTPWTVDPSKGDPLGDLVMMALATYMGGTVLAAAGGVGAGAATGGGGWVSAEGGAGYLGGQAADASELAAAAGGGAAGGAVTGSSTSSAAPVATPSTSGNLISNAIDSGTKWVSDAASNVGTKVSDFFNSVSNMFSGGSTTAAGDVPVNGGSLVEDAAQGGGPYQFGNAITPGAPATGGGGGLLNTAMNAMTKNPLATGQLLMTGASLIGGASNSVRAKEIADADRASREKMAADSLAVQQQMPAITKQANMLQGNVATVPLTGRTPAPLRRPDGSLVYGPTGIVNSVV